MSTHRGYVVCVPGERKYYVQLQYDAHGWVNTPILATLYATEESAEDARRLVEFCTQVKVKICSIVLGVEGDL